MKLSPFLLCVILAACASQSDPTSPDPLPSSPIVCRVNGDPFVFLSVIASGGEYLSLQAKGTVGTDTVDLFLVTRDMRGGIQYAGYERYSAGRSRDTGVTATGGAIVIAFSDSTHARGTFSFTGADPSGAPGRVTDGAFAVTF